MRTLQHLAKTAALAATVTTALIGLLASPMARAHDDAYLDTLKTPHGGQLRMAGPLHLELVLDKDGSAVKKRAITVHVSDHADKPLSTAGATGQITLLMGKTKVSVPLKPEGPHSLTGQASYAAVPGIKAIVTVTLAGQEAQQARFMPVPAKNAAKNAAEKAAEDAGKGAHQHDGHTSHQH